MSSRGLLPALRQFRHNDGSGTVFGYDKELTEQHVRALEGKIHGLRECLEAQGQPHLPYVPALDCSYLTVLQETADYGQKEDG